MTMAAPTEMPTPIPTLAPSESPPLSTTVRLDTQIGDVDAGNTVEEQVLPKLQHPPPSVQVICDVVQPGGIGVTIVDTDVAVGVNRQEFPDAQRAPYAQHCPPKLSWQRKYELLHFRPQQVGTTLVCWRTVIVAEVARVVVVVTVALQNKALSGHGPPQEPAPIAQHFGCQSASMKQYWSLSQHSPAPRGPISKQLCLFCSHCIGSCRFLLSGGSAGTGGIPLMNKRGPKPGLAWPGSGNRAALSRAPKFSNPKAMAPLASDAMSSTTAMTAMLLHDIVEGSTAVEEQPAS